MMEHAERQSDDERIRAFFRYQPMLTEYITYLVSHRHDAEDLSQELGVIVFHKSADLPPPEEIPRWCRGVARNLAKRYWRRRAAERMALWDDFHNVVDSAYSEAEEEQDEWGEHRRLLDDCIQRLSRSARDLLRQHYLEGERSVDIARRIRRSADSVRMMLLRIRRTLGECIRKGLSEAKVSVP
jgi:RNA polymerase sigma-70 factor (ECF subfamily)